MNARAKRIIAAVADELRVLYERHGGLKPQTVVNWAREHEKSALHSRFTWDDTKAAREYRLWQARELITEVEVIYSDRKVRQMYVSVRSDRGGAGYKALVDVLSDSERRKQFLAQAFAEYRRVGAKYQDLTELARVRAVIKEVEVEVGMVQ